MHSPSETSAPSPGSTVRRWAVLVGLTVTLAYASSFQGAFQFDDIPAIVENPTLQHLFPIGTPLSPPVGALTVSGRPLLNLSFAINYAISGYSAWSYHLLNLLIHLCATLFLFGIVRRTLVAMGLGRSTEVAAVAALLWGTHPLTTESVTYIVQRAESLTGMLLLAALYGFVRMTSPSVPGGRVFAWGLASWLSCLAAMGTKEVAAAIPVIVVLYDRTFVAGTWGGVLRRWRYHAAMAATWIFLFLLVRGNGWDRGATSGFGVGVAWVPYWLSQGEALTRYLWLSLFPYPLAFDYGLPSAPYWLAIALFGLLVLSVIATAVGCLKGRKWAFLLGSAYIVLAPTSIMPGVLQFASEHRMYLPLAAVAVGVAVLGARLVDSRPRLRPLATTLAVACVAALSATTLVRDRLYSSDLDLWADTVAKRPTSATAQANYAQALLLRNRRAEAFPHCLMAVEINPNLPTAHYNLGLVYEDEENWVQALGQYTIAATINPKLFYAQFRAGRILDRLNRPAEAETRLRAALSEEPNFGECHASLGVAEAALGKTSEAIEEYRKALAFDPKQPEVEYNLAEIYLRSGRLPEAAEHFQAASRLKPSYWEAQLNGGIVLAQEGRAADASELLEAAVKSAPSSPEAHATLGILYQQAGRTAEAIVQYRAALRLKPAYAEAHYNLGNSLLQTRDLAGAREEFAEALRLNPGLRQAREMIGRIDAFRTSP